MPISKDHHRPTARYKMEGLLYIAITACLITVAGAVTTGSDDFDLRLLTLSRRGSTDSAQMITEIEYTSRKEPVTWWTTRSAGQTTVVPTAVDFVNGRGKISATFDPMMDAMVKIGEFHDSRYSHYYMLQVPRSNTTQTQTLKTTSARSSAGYDVSYTAGEAFNVTLISPKHVAEGFTWRSHWETNDYDVILTGFWANQTSGEIVMAKTYGDSTSMGKFLKVTKNVEGDVATFQLAFTTDRETVNGFFELRSYYKADNQLSPSLLVKNIAEIMYIDVHEVQNPGPFPDNFAYVRTLYPTMSCPSGSHCYFSCVGYANDISAAKIFKEGEDGTREEVPGVDVDYRNKHYAFFETYLEITTDLAGTYVCEITSGDGVTGDTTVEITAA